MFLEGFVKQLPNSWRDKRLREGKLEGLTEAKREIAMNLMNKGFKQKEICEITGLSEIEIEGLKNIPFLRGV